jgi:M6 family metalloprotease-like protein
VRKPVVAVIVGLVLAGSLGIALAGAVKIKLPGEDPQIKRLREARYDKWIHSPIKDVPSERKLLTRSERKFPQILGSARYDTLKICAIRVEFDTVPDPSKITGNGGRFDLRDKRDSILVDPPPHDAKYFSKHMEALAYYYRAMSYGRLVIEWEVFPRDNDSSYALDNVGKYNPEGGVWTWYPENLELFFRDAILAADPDPDLTYADFDAVVIFHAGSDWQNDLNGDSPYDIPSFFITLYDDSIVVDGGTHSIVDGSVVPETTSQDGFLNGINGVLAHEIGHQLGLPDLYDTGTGMSVVGYWCLMDFGSGIGVVLEDTLTNNAYYVTGILPGSICGWSRDFLGWARPDTVIGDAEVSLNAIELQGEFPSSQMVMVPINSYEHYLIENRQTDLDGDDAGYLLVDPSPDSTGVILGPVNENSEFNYEFDFALPGSGLLVWHVDQIMVQVLNRADLVNAFRGRTGVHLKEADGIPDLGDFNSFYFLGSPDDPFRAGNNDRLADNTYPASTSNTGCSSHILIDEISESGLTMSFKVSPEWGVGGSPVAMGDGFRFGVPSVLVCDTDEDGKDEIYAALTRAGWAYDDTVTLVYLRSEIHGYQLDGEGFLAAIDGWPRRLYGSYPGELVGVDFDGDGDVEIVATDETRRLYGFTHDGQACFAGSDSLGSFVELEWDMNGGPVGVSLGDSGMVFAGTDSALYVVNSSGGVLVYPVSGEDSGISRPILADVWSDLPPSGGPELIYYKPGMIVILNLGQQEGPEVIGLIPVSCVLPPDSVYLCAADLDRAESGGLEVILVGKDGWVSAFKLDGETVPGWGRKICNEVAAPPAIADVNSDGYLEIVLSDRNYRTWTLLHTGSTAWKWPRSWFGCSLPTWDSTSFAPASLIDMPSPVLGDFNADGAMDVIQGSLFECITAWDPAGDRLGGFPLSLGGGCSALALGDLDGDESLEMVGGGADGRVDLYLDGIFLDSIQYSEGFLYAFKHPDAPDSMVAPWRMAFRDQTRNAVYPLDLMPGLPEPGDRLLVRGSFRAYPNPAGEVNPSTGRRVVWFAFETDTGGKANIEVFDITGVKVKTMEYDVAQSTLITIPPQGLDIGDLGNGLYLCRLSLRGGGKESTDFFKLAVRR